MPPRARGGRAGSKGRGRGCAGRGRGRAARWGGGPEEASSGSEEPPDQADGTDEEADEAQGSGAAAGRHGPPHRPRSSYADLIGALQHEDEGAPAAKAAARQERGARREGPRRKTLEEDWRDAVANQDAGNEPSTISADTGKAT